MKGIMLFVAATCVLSLRSMADPALPAGGFDGNRYSTLWTKSPFAIATPVDAAASADYDLVGLAQFDGISYASLVTKQTQEHFVLSSDRPVRDLTLVAVRPDPKDGNIVIIERNGEQFSLHQDTVPAANPAPLAIVAPLSASELENPSVGGMGARAWHHPPRAHLHRPVIVVPPRPQN